VNGKYCLVPYYLKRDYVRALELLRQANLLGPAFTNGWEVGIYLRKRSVRRNAGGIGEGQSREERRSDFDLQYGHGLRGTRAAGRSTPDHQGAGRKVGREPGSGGYWCSLRKWHGRPAREYTRRMRVPHQPAPAPVRRTGLPRSMRP